MDPIINDDILIDPCDSKGRLARRTMGRFEWYRNRHMARLFRRRFDNLILDLSGIKREMKTNFGEH